MKQNLDTSFAVKGIIMVVVHCYWWGYLCMLFHSWFLHKGESETSQEIQSKEEEEEHRTQSRTRMLLILMKVGNKLIINPNTYATFI